jgi:hypothetical protein
VSTEKKMLNPDKKHKPQLQGLEQQQIHPLGLYYQPQPLRCTHHFQRRERERETTGHHCLSRRPTSKSFPTSPSTQKTYTTLTPLTPLPPLSFRSFTEHSTIEPAIVITADSYTPNRLSGIRTRTPVLQACRP